jgi:hypothetical protein
MRCVAEGRQSETGKSVRVCHSRLREEQGHGFAVTVQAVPLRLPAVHSRGDAICRFGIAADSGKMTPSFAHGVAGCAGARDPSHLARLPTNESRTPNAPSVVVA